MEWSQRPIPKPVASTTMHHLQSPEETWVPQSSFISNVLTQYLRNAEQVLWYLYFVSLVVSLFSPLITAYRILGELGISRSVVCPSLSVVHFIHYNWADHCVNLDTYYIAFPRDRLFLKIIVYGVFILEFIQSILTTKDAFGTFANGLGNWIALSRVRLLWFSVPILGGIGESDGLESLDPTHWLILLFSGINCSNVSCLPSPCPLAVMGAHIASYRCKQFRSHSGCSQLILR